MEPESQPEPEREAQAEPEAAQAAPCWTPRAGGEDPRVPAEAYTAMPGARRSGMWKLAAALAVAAALGAAGLRHHAVSHPPANAPAAHGQLGQ